MSPEIPYPWAQGISGEPQLSWWAIPVCLPQSDAQKRACGTKMGSDHTFPLDEGAFFSASIPTLGPGLVQNI